MANNCYFKMLIKGKESSVKEFISKMEKGELGRLLSGAVIDEYLDKRENEKIFVFEGDCAWSIKTAFLDKYQKFLGEASRLRVDIEVYSREIGFEFEEYYYIEKGRIKEEALTDYYEYWFDDNFKEDWSETAERLCENFLAKEKGITIGNYQNFIDKETDSICLGGFDEWNFKF